MTPALPRVTAATGCAGSGRELARFGELAALDAVQVGPVGLPEPTAPRARLTPSPSGLVHSPAPVIPVQQVVTDLLPWCAARGLRVICAVRAGTVGVLADILQQLRRALDFTAVIGLEIDLAAVRQHTRPAVGALPTSDPVSSWSADPQGCLKLVAEARELLPRDLLLLAKLGGECPDPVATARAAVGGGARALVLSGAVPALGPGHYLVGPAVGPVTLGLVQTIREAMTAGRIPQVPLVAVGGVHDAASALAARQAGASSVQIGSGLLGDPELLWRLHHTLGAVTTDSGDPDPADTRDRGGLHDD